LASEAIEKTANPVCAPPSLPWVLVGLVDLVGLPVALMQPGTLEALGTIGLYWFSVAWGATVAIMIPHFTRLRFCPLLWMWVALSCLGGAAFYFGG
jgi:hypothetical protein